MIWRGFGVTVAVGGAALGAQRLGAAESICEGAKDLQCALCK